MARPKHRFLAVLSAAAMLCAMAACSEDSSVSDQTADHSSVSENSSAPENSTAQKDESSSGGAKPEDPSSKQEESSNDVSQPDPTESSADSEDSSKPEDSGASQSTVTTTATSATQNSQSSSTTASDAESSEVKEIKYIYLQDTTAQYSGSGIMVDGSTVTITKGGTYVISGTLNGALQVLTDDKKVYLELDNAHINNAAGAALNVQQAKRISITTLKGTVNSFTDGGVHEETRGAIFTNDTIELNGEGVLNITANYAHGIRSDDDIILNRGTVNIQSTNSGFHCNDGIEINGGSLFCNAGTNGIKTEGYITITGGHSVFIGGNREEKGAIHCDGVFSYHGGTFYAIGNLCAIPDAASSTANAVAIAFTNLFGPNRAVNVRADGKDVLTITSPNNFRYVVFGGAGLTTEGSYSVSAGGTMEGAATNYIGTAGNYSGGNAYFDFAASGVVTSVTVES